MYWLPRTRIGNISFWTGVCSFALIYLQYWTAMLLHASIVFPGVILLGILCIVGITSVIALVKYKDHAMLLLLSALLGALGWLFVIGEIFFPH